MASRLYIEGRDVYALFGVFITEGGYKDLVNYAPLKKATSVDYHEQDGEVFDLSAPALDTRNITISFAAHGPQANIEAFVELLTTRAIRKFEFRDLGRTYRLRLVSPSTLTLGQQIGLFSLVFADDFPLSGYTYRPPQSTLSVSSGYALDGIDLSQYGVLILKGTREEVEKTPPVKPNLLRNFSAQHGAQYDSANVTYKVKEVKIRCLMRASTLLEFWRNYDAMIFDLVRPGDRSLSVGYLNRDFPCHYKSCSVSEFYATGKIWFKFDITLVFTSFRPIN